MIFGNRFDEGYSDEAVEVEMTAFDRNRILCKKDLEAKELEGIEGVLEHPLSQHQLSYVRIKGYMGFGEDGKPSYRDAFKNVLSSINYPRSVFSFVIKGTKAGLEFYIGLDDEYVDSLKSTFAAFVPGADFSEVRDYYSLGLSMERTSVVTGIPSDWFSDTYNYNQMDDLCRGMVGKEFAFIVFATRLEGFCSVMANNRMIEELQECSENVQVTIGGAGVTGKDSIQSTNYEYAQYQHNLEEFKKIIDEGLNTGLWDVCSFIVSQSDPVLSQLKGIIKAIFTGEGEEGLTYEPIRCIDLNERSGFMDEPKILDDEDMQGNMYPFGTLNNDGVEIDFQKYKYRTILSSSVLSIMCRLPLHEFPGIYIDDYVMFDTSMRTARKSGNDVLSLGSIVSSGRASGIAGNGNSYDVDIKDLSRHALVIGATGGGKTNTIKSILKKLWTKGYPFLVIESAKREYWDLYNVGFEEGYKNFKDLAVYTLGLESRENSIKYRINPFEVVGNSSIQTHIDSLLSTFEAAFELYPPMPYVLETSVYEIYEDRGWDIVENRNRFGLKEYPTLTNLYYKIDAVTDRLGYDKEIQSNVKAALKARINSLRIGGKGAMLDTPASSPIGDLLKKPTILELDDLGDDETKAFVMGILMVQLYEFRKHELEATTSNTSVDFCHLLVIEEAHRLLSASSPSNSATGNSSKQKAVEFFCNMLAEIRTFGQGLMIVDQIPTKLAIDTIKNTNLKVVHRTVMKEDREAIGYAMNMSEEQIGYLSSLKRGVAAVYAEGDNKPKLVQLPLVKPAIDSLSRKEVISRIRENIGEKNRVFSTKYDYTAACAFCEKRCLFKEKIDQDVEKHKDQIREFYIEYFNTKETKRNAKAIYDMLEAINVNRGLSYDRDELLCLAGKVLEMTNFGIENRHEACSKLIEKIYGGKQ